MSSPPHYAPLRPRPRPTKEEEEKATYKATKEEREHLKEQLPKGAVITNVTKTKEGYDVEYYVPEPKPKPRPPPKTVQEWIGRAGEGITEVFTTPYRIAVGRGGKSYIITESERQKAFFAYTMVGTQKPITPALVKTVEETQQWLRDVPAKPTLRITPTGIRYEKPFEPVAQALEVLMVPIGVVRSLEATVGKQPSIAGAGFATAISPLPGVQVGPIWVGGRGRFTAEPMTHYWEKTKKHPLLVPGEIIGEFIQAKYLWGPLLAGAWKGTKWVARKTKTEFVKWAYPRRIEQELFERIVVAPKIAKQLVPEEKSFTWLVKTKKGWTYQTVKQMEKITVGTGKKTALPSTLWKKPKAFKPTPAKWYPPAPMKATVLRELPKEFVAPSGKGMALITKQVSKKVSKQVVKRTLPKFALLEPAVAFVAVKTVPSLVKYKGPLFPSIYKQPKEVTTLTKFAPYPKRKRKEVEKRVIPQPLKLPREILRETQLPREVQKQKALQTFYHVVGLQVTRQVFAIRRFELPKAKKRRKRRVPRLGEEWFFKVHPLATPKEVAELTFKPKKNRRRVRKYVLV